MSDGLELCRRFARWSGAVQVRGLLAVQSAETGKATGSHAETRTMFAGRRDQFFAGHSRMRGERQNTAALGLFMKLLLVHKGVKRKHAGHSWVERKLATGSLVQVWCVWTGERKQPFA